MMQGFNDTLVIRKISCPEDCRACIDACTRHRGLPALRTAHVPEAGFHSLIVCNQCSQPHCAEVCPTAAITKDGDSGTVTIDGERCVGCGLCTLACPYGGIYYDYTEEKSLKCDRCPDEEPPCAAACPHGVLSFRRSRAVYQHYHDRDLSADGTGLCAGCPAELGARIMLRVVGPKALVFRTPGCQPIFLSRVCSIGTLMTNTASCMVGASRYYQKIGRDDVISVCFVGDGATADVGFQPLSGAAARGERILYICNDNEAYMNTGIQSSSTTPLGSWSTTTWVGKKFRGKEYSAKYMPLIMLMHNVSYVATATVAYLEDYVRKLEKAKEAVKHGMAYIHLYTPCPTGWRAPVDSGIELGRLAVETNYFPLWEAEEGKVRFTHHVEKPRPIRDFLRGQGRFSHLTDEEYALLQQATDERLALIQKLAAD